MKKIIALLLALALMVSMTACGGQEETEETEAATQAATEATTPAQEESVSDGNTLSYTFTQFGNAKMTILGAEFLQDDYGEDVLRIYYDYTNTSDSACNQYPTVALDFKSITQDGNDLRNKQFSYMDECAIAEDLQCDLPVQPGLTSRQTMLIPCDPNGGVVEVSCYIMIGSWVYEEDKVECFTFQIDPKNLPAVPEPLVMEPITNPTYAVGLPSSGVTDYPNACEMSIDGIELTSGGEGERVLRVKLTVTNNDEEAMMPVTITNGVEAYQDGLGLRWFSDWDLEDATEADAAYNEDLAPGETVQCNALFVLRNENPVEIVIEDLDCELRLGKIVDVKAAMEEILAAEEAQQQAADAASAAARAALVGTWLQRDSDWEDTYTFNADGTGLLVSGPEYPFTYAVSGDTLTITYDPEDVEEFTISVDGNVLTMINMWDEELILDKQQAEETAPVVEETEATKATEATEATKATEVTQATEAQTDLADYILGTWEDLESGYHETFTFNADGTGLYSYTDGGLWEFTFTYEVLEDDSVDIYYDDGDIGGFWITIQDEDTMLITNSAVTDMVFVRK